MSRFVQLIFGPPGTGKTEYLTRTVEEHLAQGTPPERIGFVSFSRRAVREAVDRAIARFPGSSRQEFPWFRTIHSLAFKLLGLSRDDVLQPKHLRGFAQQLGIPLRTSVDENSWEGTAGDKALALYHLAKARGTSPEHEWRNISLPNVTWDGVRYVCDAYEQYKRRMALWDFSDMITSATGTLDLDVLIVDESQDTSAAQWQFLRRAAQDVPAVYLAADDDQSIFEWSGADPAQLWRLHGQRIVLPRSYRLPRAVHTLAERVVHRIRQRVEKQYAPTDQEGAVRYLGDYEQLNLRTGRHLLLARNNYQLQALRDLCRRQGVVYSMADGTWSSATPAVVAAQAYERLRKGKTVSPGQAQAVARYVRPRPSLTKQDQYAWRDVLGDLNPVATWMDGLTNLPTHERQYIRALRQSGEPLTGEGRVRVSTVHGIKGGEEDHVVLLTDLSATVAAQARTHPDAELRVQYVGITRAKETLTVVRPTGPAYWRF